MKKNLIAVAVAAACALPLAANAGGHGNNNKFYGHAHVAVDVVGGDFASTTNVATPSSRLGFKGWQKLGNGMKAIYQFEWAVGVSDTGNDLGQRNQYVGLKGDFGTALLGRHDTPMKSVGRKVDLFWSTQLGESRQIIRDNTAGSAGWDQREDNVIAYVSPKMNGFTFTGAYVTDLDTGNSLAGVGNDDAVSASLTYGNGPMWIGFAYEKHELAAGDESAFRLAGSYKVSDAVKVVGIFQGASDMGGVNGADRDIWGIGATYDAGNGNIFKAQYYNADDIDGTANSGADSYSIGLDHYMAKNIAIYGTWTAMNNDNAAAFGIGGSGHVDAYNAGAGSDVNGFSLGMRYKF